MKMARSLCPSRKPSAGPSPSAREDILLLTNKWGVGEDAFNSFFDGAWDGTGIRGGIEWKEDKYDADEKT
jgi:hypothetical protein